MSEMVKAALAHALHVLLGLLLVGARPHLGRDQWRKTNAALTKKSTRMT
jgi:hypothetical protein